MDSRAEELITQGDKLFSDRSTLNTLWQEIAENFYPERADFTVQRVVGTEFAGNLLTSYPVMARRDLGNSFSTMLRPTQSPWFGMNVDEKHRTNDAKRYLDYTTGVMKRALYDKKSQFIRASKEGDHDFAAFGQCCKTVELNKRGDGLLFRCWHLRDVAWAEDYEGKIVEIHRKWKPYAIQLASQFPGKSPKLDAKAEKAPYDKVECRHIVIPSENYRGAKKYKTPYVGLYIDVDNQVVLEEVGLYNRMYWIPRWQTVSGSQYSYSPATVAALPDARLIQAMTLTLLEAGEKATNPPMVAVQEAIRGDIALYAGAVTFVDAEYDERLGEVLRPLNMDMRGMPIGRDLRNDIREMISQAFFLNKIALPPIGREMTAFEVSQRVQDYIRQAMPLFEPVEMEDNGEMCEMVFDLLLRGGAFGSILDMPQELRGANVEFEFVSPLRDSEDKQKGALFLQTKEILAAAVALDPGSAGMIDSRTALRETLDGIGVPAKWVFDEKQMQQIDAINAQKQQAQQLLQTMQSGANVAKTIGEAGQSMGMVQQ